MSQKYTFDGLKQYLKYHLYLKSKAKENELEVRFGTNKATRISKIQYDNTISFLKSHNFTSNNESGVYTLKILGNEGPIRAEIFDMHCIREYCMTNSIEKVMTDSPSNVTFTSKTPVIFNEETQEEVPQYNNRDYNFKIGYNKEEIKAHDDAEIASFIMNTPSKLYRYINRISYTHPDYPLVIDFSVVKAKQANNNKSIQESDLFNVPEVYEIEIELDNEKCLTGSVDPNDLYAKVQKVITNVLCGIQNTFYPIKQAEHNEVLNDYTQRMNMKYPQFCGPSSLTLQLEHLHEENNDNILTDYTVTDKADGLRKLLYITSIGKVFFITTNLEVQYCGFQITNPEIFDTLIDGEHILYDKNNNFINVYAAFDCYVVKEESKMNLPLFKTPKDSAEGRYSELKKVVQTMRSNSSNPNLLTLVCKKFNVVSDKSTLFEECNNLFKSINNDEKYNYNTDGLIFTPRKLAVGSKTEGDNAPPAQKMTWSKSFKWKPPEYNTIDFLVTYPRDKANTFYIENGETKKYKIINLRIGFSNKRHGHLNPFKDVIDGKFKKEGTDEDYNPALFYPTNPYDTDTHICHIPLIIDEYGNEQMFTENKEVFADNMIVEFKYQITGDKYKGWVPLKVRYDKTLDLRTNGKNFGNAYHVANSNWHSIHRPVTEDVLTSGNVPRHEDDDIYYNKYRKSKTTMNMRHFHNKIKGYLIDYASTLDSGIMLDMAVGKGGDIRKWYYNKQIRFVLGIDISKDNIENKIDGACKRYIEEQKSKPSEIQAIFLTGDLSKNIKNGEAFNNTQTISISDGIFGKGSKNIDAIGKVAFENYGTASKGFNIVSCQFALHYFFKDKATFKNFMINLVECTALNGVFVGTCYDGKTVHNLLKEGNFTSREGNELLLSISKKYDNETFPNDSNCLGYAIEIFQESINKPITEYLVNFEFFIRIMENYGFVLEKPTTNDYFDSAVDSFKTLHNNINKTINTNKTNKTTKEDGFHLTDNEKKISYLNKYFIFKKVRAVNIEEVVWDETEIFETEETLPPPTIKKPTKMKLKIKKT